MHTICHHIILRLFNPNAIDKSLNILYLCAIQSIVQLSILKPMDIKNICKHCNKTMQEVALEVGITPNNFGTVMRGNPTLATINRVAEALDITPQQLVELLNKK